jgi:hypothetical protein
MTSPTGQDVADLTRTEYMVATRAEVLAAAKSHAAYLTVEKIMSEPDDTNIGNFALLHEALNAWHGAVEEHMHAVAVLAELRLQTGAIDEMSG